ncbi:MAG: glycosyl hydrolase [Chromatiales bacterium 21-64-14]|nr:MAG: glycosyl hydrolase [Chromatiales bacterium 21-64-14]HQU15707.1 glycoside hydrolase family 15 protein [Gammaproteobacteria bacterium]
MSAVVNGSSSTDAPGAPGLSPTWCSSAKEAVGCALGDARLWFSVGGGILNEVYYPRVDIPQIRDLGFVVGDGHGFWVEVKRLGTHTIELPGPGIPALRIVHRHERFELILRIAPDPRRDVLLIEVTLEGDENLRPYALLAPHLGGTGHDNMAAVAQYRGRRMLWAEHGPFGLALAAADPHQRDAWGRAGAGYVGVSDGWQDFSANGTMRWEYAAAGPGNVALTGELPRHAVLALALGSSKQSAATLAISALLQTFDSVWNDHVARWEAWHAHCGICCAIPEDLAEHLRAEFLASAMVLRTHQDRIYPGAMVASLSVPWGNTRDEVGGYHLVWPRDLVESAEALVALGAEREARDVLRYLIATQCDDGHWYQNQWLGGKPYWQGVQLDEAAFPVLLAANLAERGLLEGIEAEDMVRRALSFLARTGPASDQDRWEEDAGVNAFTLAACIAALVAGARFLEPAARAFALALADYWNTQIEAWTAAYDTPLARRFGVHGYYIREAPIQTLADKDALHHVLPIKNRIHDPGLAAEEQVGVDFLQLVRFGLRQADDTLVRDTLTVVDGILKVDTPVGPVWHRYTGDGYGEHVDGSAFNGTGRGRGWPLLTGERGHYALAAGRDPRPYLEAMAAMAGTGGMIPEQVWDTLPLAAHNLELGRPSGSAMPLVWAHAEFIKLVRSRELGYPIDRPADVWERYQGRRPAVEFAIWLPQAPIRTLPAGTRLWVCAANPVSVHWGVDGWGDIQDTLARDTGLGLYTAELDTRALQPGQRVQFTLRDVRGGQWADHDYEVDVTDGSGTTPPR